MTSITLHIAALECPMAFAIPLRKAKDVDELQELIRRRANRKADIPITMYDHNKSVILWEDWEDIVKPDGIYLADFGSNFRRYLAKESGSDRSILADSNLGILAAAISGSMLGPLSSSPAPSASPFNVSPAPITKPENISPMSPGSSVGSCSHTITDHLNKHPILPVASKPAHADESSVAPQKKKNVGAYSIPSDGMAIKAATQTIEGNDAVPAAKASPLENISTAAAASSNTATASSLYSGQRFDPPKQPIPTNQSSKPGQQMSSGKKKERQEANVAVEESFADSSARQRDTEKLLDSRIGDSKLHDIKVYVSKSTSPGSTMELDVPPESTIEEIVVAAIAGSEFVTSLTIQEFVGGIGGTLKSVDKFNQSSTHYKSTISEFGTKHPVLISLQVLTKAPATAQKHYK